MASTFFTDKVGQRRARVVTERGQLHKQNRCIEELKSLCTGRKLKKILRKDEKKRDEKKGINNADGATLAKSEEQAATNSTWLASQLLIHSLEKKYVS